MTQIVQREVLHESLFFLVNFLQLHRWKCEGVGWRDKEEAPSSYNYICEDVLLRGGSGVSCAFVCVPVGRITLHLVCMS